MQDNPSTVKPADAIGPIDYPVKFERAALPTGVFFAMAGTVNMITGSLSKTLSLIFIAVLLVCALYALFRAWPLIQGWFATHPRLTTVTHFAVVFFGALAGFALMAGGK